MHNNELKGGFLRFSTHIIGVLSILFWVLVIYGFDAPYVAGLTVICAVIHEGGHLLANGKVRGRENARGRLTGFGLQKNKFNSYKEDFFLAAAGPMANILTAVIALPFLGWFEGYVVIFVSVSLATALANLLPIKGHDGYNMLLSLVSASDTVGVGVRVLETVSQIFGGSLCLFSLYLMDRIGEGYWLFAVFYISLLEEVGQRLR